jgi:hypothetical protein
MLSALTNVRFWGQSGHDANGPLCRLMTHSGHCPHADWAIRAAAAAASGTATSWKSPARFAAIATAAGHRRTRRAPRQDRAHAFRAFLLDIVDFGQRPEPRSFKHEFRIEQLTLPFDPAQRTSTARLHSQRSGTSDDPIAGTLGRRERTHKKNCRMILTGF